MQSFEGIDGMLKREVIGLEQVVLETLTAEQQTSVSKGLRQVQHLTKTLSGLMRNIIHEQKKSRDEMLRIMGLSEAGDVSPGRFSAMEFEREREEEEEERKGEDSTDNEYIEYNEDEENEIFHDA